MSLNPLQMARDFAALVEASSIVADALLTDDSGDTYTVPAEDMQRLRDALGWCRQCCIPEHEHGIVTTHAFLPPPPESP